MHAFLESAYKMHMNRIWNAYQMHMKCISNAYEMHIECIWNACGFLTFLLFFFRFKSFVVATCDCYLIKQHSYFWLLLAISTCDCYVRYIHIVTFDCYLLLLLVNSPFTQLLVIGTCEWYLWLVYFWFVLVMILVTNPHSYLWLVLVIVILVIGTCGSVHFNAQVNLYSQVSLIADPFVNDCSREVEFSSKFQFTSRSDRWPICEWMLTWSGVLK